MRTPTRDRTGRSTRLLLIVWAGLLSLLMPTTAHAITNGTPDTKNVYDQVGSFIVEVTPADGSARYKIQLCTGTLISARVVLTASHCMDPGDYPSTWGEVTFTLEQRIADDGSWRVRDNLPLLTGTPVPDKRYTGKAHYAYDVGAFVLDVALQFASYPTLGTVKKSQRGEIFTTVGYGIERTDKTTSTAAFMPPKERMIAEQPLLNVTPHYATFSMNLARGHGGTCYGDSGGPHFNAAGEIVAITTTGDIPCKAIDQAVRVDTKEAQSFLAPVLANPDAYVTR